MTWMEDDRVARRGDELARDRGSRRVSSVIDVQRRLGMVVDVFLVGKSRAVVSDREVAVVDDRPCEPSD